MNLNYTFCSLSLLFWSSCCFLKGWQLWSECHWVWHWEQNLYLQAVHVTHCTKTSFNKEFLSLFITEQIVSQPGRGHHIRSGLMATSRKTRCHFEHFQKHFQIYLYQVGVVWKEGKEMEQGFWSVETVN